MAEIKENIVAFADGDEYIYVEYQNRRLKNKIRLLKEEYPESVEIRSDDLDGGLSAKLNSDTFVYPSLRPKRRLSEEQRIAASERFKQMWADRLEKEEE